MPLSPTPGSAALAAGFTLWPGTGLASDIEEYANRSLDEVATKAVLTGGGAVPIANGGTGATTAAAARTNLGVPEVGATVRNTSWPTNAILMRWELSRIVATIDASDQGQLAYVSDVNGAANQRVARSGDSMSGDLFLPNSSAASSSWTTAFINGDGRVSRGSSSERYKKNISERDPMDLGDLFSAPWVRYQMRADSALPNDGHMPADPTWRFGYIAESLIGTDLEGFVVYVNGQVESIDFIGLLLAQAAQLNARALAAEARADALEARLAALEARMDGYDLAS